MIVMRKKIKTYIYLIVSRQNMISVHLRAIAFAVSQSFVFFALAGGFRYGAHLIENDDLPVDHMFK